MNDDSNTNLALRMIAQMAALIFLTEGVIMLALADFQISWADVREGLIDASALTMIVSPITYWFMVNPFVRRARAATEMILAASLKSQQQAQELAATLADLNVQKRILDHHCLVTRTDAMGRITYANDEFCRISGFSREEILGNSHQIINSGHHTSEFWKDMHQALSRDGIWQNEICNRAKDGRLYWLQSTNVAEKDTNGDLVGYFSVSSDITTTKLREQELSLTHTELRKAMEKAEAASESKSRFLSTMSHEMRTPLNGVIGAMELLKLEPLSDRQKELLQLAVQSSDALLVHINDVLDFSKLEAGKFELNLMPFNLRYMIKSVAEIVSHRVTRQGNRLATRVSEGLPERFIGDPVRIRQVLLNFASNAAKFCHNGQIDISASLLASTEDSFKVEFSVTDTGPGIAAEQLDNLFKEFSMLDNSFARKAEGTGLGLAISKSLVEAMNGRVGVDSEPGRGSRFWFAIELKQTEERLHTAEHDGEDSSALNQLKILLVDDNKTNRMVGSRLIESIGHEVELASSGIEAVTAADHRTFDVILMDVSMPEMDGIEATRLIRSKSRCNRQTPIIALTAHAVLGDRDRFMKAGMSEYLSKPLRLRDLRARIAVVMAPGAHGQDAAPTEKLPTDECAQVLDQQELVSLAEQTSPDVVVEVVREFLGEAPGKVAALLEAMRAGNPDETQKAAHAVAGSSLSIGAASLGDFAKQIEKKCIDGAFSEVSGSGARVSELHSQTTAALEAYVQTLLPQAA